MAERRAVLLINHGSRQAHAAIFVADLAATLRLDDPARTVAVSFLELNRPSPGAALRQLVRDGISDVQVVPLLFSAGYHYGVDVSAAVAAVLEDCPAVRVQIAPPLLGGGAEGLIEALDARLGETTDVGSSPAAPLDGLVLLAAGSSQPDARAGVAELAQAWGASHGLPAGVAFCDLRGADVVGTISRLRAGGAQRIACGALFLAAGRLHEAGHRAALSAGVERVARPLGMTPALIDLIRQRGAGLVPAG